MNILFVYSFTRIWNLFADGIGKHRAIYATFRREYAHEPVEPLYVFSRKSTYARQSEQILSETELLNSFRFTRSLGLVRGNDMCIIDLGRKYEQFYHSIFKKENIACIVNWNLGYGFQYIGHLLAKKLGIRTYIMEGGLFRPFTLTTEPEGVNAHSMLKLWNNNNERTEYDAELFEKFRKYYHENHYGDALQASTIPAISTSMVERLKRELKQRYIYDFIDPETYHHNWLRRLLKVIIRRILSDRFFILRRGEKVITFFLSSVYDPQLEIPTRKTISNYICAVLDGFKLFRRNHPDYWLLVKEHPLDESRSLFWDLYKRANRDDRIRWTVQSAAQLIPLCDGVITINSTLGIDALIHRKPILCIGDSCYRHEGITVPCPDSLSAEDVEIALERLATFRPDEEAANSFLQVAFNKTQIPVWHTSTRKEDIRNGLLLFLESSDKLQDRFEI